MSVTPYMPVYRRADVTMVRGEGVYLYDSAGERYLDCASGIAVNSLGHGHPHVVAALKEQADKLWHCSNNYKNDQLLRFSQRLIDASELDSVFFCSSGQEAVEAGIKFIRRYHYANGDPERQRIITFEGGFHGRSITCISAGGNEAAREGYAPLLEGFDRVAFNDLDAVKAAITAQTAGMMLEPIQGEGGVNVADREFLHGLRSLADEHGLLLYFDEVQCGYGRSGALFTHTLFEVSPDLVACAKGIGNGFPLGACLVSEAVAEAMTPGCHGSTYGSNPLAMAVGNAVLDIVMNEEFSNNTRKTGEFFRAKLQAVADNYSNQIESVKGLGLMLGVKLRSDARSFAGRLQQNGLLVAPAYDDVLRFVPPLIISHQEVEDAVGILKRTLDEVGQ